MTEHCDVVIVGAGIAGCTAAILYARAGLRVVLIEAHSDIAMFKRTCTHLIQSSAVPTLRRLGLDHEIEATGGVRSEVEIHTRFGWIGNGGLAGPQPDYGYNLRRSELDPLLRRTAAETAGVQLMLGARVRKLHRNGGRFTGLTAQAKSGESVLVEASLIVGADGRHSQVAKLAELPTKRREHGRFGFFAHFVGVRSKSGYPLVQPTEGAATATAQLWLRDPDVAYAFPSDAGRTVLSLMVPSARKDQCRADFEGYLRSTFGALPDGPDLTEAERVSDFTGVVNYPSLTRRPVHAGVTLVGDAAMVSDYLWGVGCGWAFQSAEWLADATVAPLLSGRGLSGGLRKYAWRLRRRLALHQAWNANYASGRLLKPLERMMFSAGVTDPLVAGRLLCLGTRSSNAATIFNPALLLRALLAPRPSTGRVEPRGQGLDNMC